jgi:hypothetical protein
MTHRTAFAVIAVAACLGGASAQAETITKEGTNATGQKCTVSVNRNADGSITTAGASGGSASAGGVSSSSSVGGSSVHVQAGGGSGASASVVTVNGCTISTSSP